MIASLWFTGNPVSRLDLFKVSLVPTLLRSGRWSGVLRNISCHMGWGHTA